jgi:hypothetical protein
MHRKLTGIAPRRVQPTLENFASLTTNIAVLFGQEVQLHKLPLNLVTSFDPLRFEIRRRNGPTRTGTPQ